ncbi:MAG: 4-hydroxy-3-methylbut-2-enyl diphosphate reductase [Desulfovibrionales bacterium]
MRTEQNTSNFLPSSIEHERVLRASTAGFCMGVALALKKLDRSLARNKEVATYTYGPIIHNPHVLEKYAELGVRVLSSVDTINLPAQIIIRAHGIPKGVEEELSLSGAMLVDATCPKVKRAQTLIAEWVHAGRKLLLLGERDHPEVEGLLSYAGEGALVFESLEKLLQIPLASGTDYFLAAQTTQDRKEFAAVTETLKKRFGPDFPVLDTICNATSRRQKEAQKLAEIVDYMVVVGGMQSGNTRRLAQVVRDCGTPCVHIEDEKQLPIAKLQAAASVGLTAGASTPGSIIDRVEERIRMIQSA